jgi:hypothetical protein
MRARRSVRPQTARSLLVKLPADPMERLVVLDQALRRVEAQAPPGRVRELRMRLGRVRFGGGEPDDALEADIRELVTEVER